MKKEIVRQFSHLLAGFLLLLHGFQAFERDEHNTAYVYLGMAVFFLIVAGIHPWLIRQFRKVDALFFMLETIALYFSTWQYYHEGNKTMPIVTGMIATFFLWYSLYLFFTKSRRHKRRRRSRRPGFNEEPTNL